MSHELRTPLNAIIGVSEMLREDAEALKQDLEPLDRVLGAGRHLLALINDILDLSKIKAGRLAFHLDTFELRSLIDDVVKTIEPLAAKSGNRVVAQCDDAIKTMHADQTRVRQTLLNLASNANKFTEKGTVTIDARQRAEDGRDWMTIAVADTGAGHGRTDGQAIPGVFPSLLRHREQIRRHGPWPRHQPALLPNDGRRYHGWSEARAAAQDLHDPAATNCGSSKGAGGRLTTLDATRECRMIEPRKHPAFSSIAVSDLDASQKFYTEILGLTLVQTAPANGMVFLRAGNDHVILAKSDAPLQRDAKDSRRAHHAFKVDSESYEDAKTFLASREVEVFKKKMKERCLRGPPVLYSRSRWPYRVHGMGRH